MAPIGFRLWVFDNVPLTDVKREELRNLIDKNFMNRLVGGSIASAISRVVGQNELLSPGKFDAVVFLTTIGFMGAGSIMKRAGIDPQEAVGNQNVKGLTVTPLTEGGIAEVYWNRCETLSDVASAIFHEAGHLKFNDKSNEMHNSVGSNKQKVKILASHTTGNAMLPNDADIEIFKSKIANVITLRIKSP